MQSTTIYKHAHYDRLRLIVSSILCRVGRWSYPCLVVATRLDRVMIVYGDFYGDINVMSYPLVCPQLREWPPVPPCLCCHSISADSSPFHTRSLTTAELLPSAVPSAIHPVQRPPSPIAFCKLYSLALPSIPHPIWRDFVCHSIIH